MKEFWALVSNSQRLKKNRGLRRTIWWRIYAVFFSLLALTGYSYLIIQAKVSPFTMLVAIPYLVLAGFGLSVASIRQEWKNQTVAWWLTLPYPRFKLLLAKLTANFLHFLKIITGAITISALLAVEGMLFRPDVWTPDMIASLAVAAVKLYPLAVAFSPLAITLGMFLGILLESRLKPLTPVIWAATIFVLISSLNHLIRILGFGTKGNLAAAIPQMPSFNMTLMLFLVVIPWVLAVIFFSLSAYILTEQTEI